MHFPIIIIFMAKMSEVFIGGILRLVLVGEKVNLNVDHV